MSGLLNGNSQLPTLYSDSDIGFPGHTWWGTLEGIQRYDQYIFDVQKSEFITLFWEAMCLWVFIGRTWVNSERIKSKLYC